MIRFLSESEQVARKEYQCMASEFILNAGINGFGYSFAELRVIAKAKKQNYKITKCQRYYKQNNIEGGVFFTFRAIPEMHQICLNHDLYGDL